MNRPFIGAGGAETIAPQIGALTDAHAGVTNQQNVLPPRSLRRRNS